MRKQDTAVVVALAIGFAVIVPFHLTFSIITRRSALGEEPEALLIHVAMAAMPFLILAGKDLYEKLTWVVGVALTIPAWALALYVGTRYTLTGDTSGVGGEAAIFVAWPFLVSVLCVRLARWRSD